MIFESLLRRVALHDHRRVEDELSAPLVISPDATSLRERCCTSEEMTQDGQGLGHPELLIDSLLITVDARNKEHQHRRCALLSLQDLGPLGHHSLLRVEDATFGAISQGSAPTSRDN